MRILIEISEDAYNKLTQKSMLMSASAIDEAVDAVKNGRIIENGHWIEQEEYNGDIYYDCSACGESWCTIDGTPWQNGMDFCPHCGAKMEKGES